MSQASVLREFIVKLGWSNDEAGQKRFEESLAKISKGAIEITKNFISVGAAVGGTAVAAAVGLNKIAESYKSLYFAAQRTGASANELDTLKLAFEKIGVSAEETQQALEGFSAARRSMPGIDQMFRIDPKQTDNAKAFIQVLSQLANQDTGGPFTHAIAAQKAGYIGISEQTLTQFENNRGAFVKGMQDSAKIVDKFNVNKMAKTGLSYAKKFLDTKTNLELTGDKVATGVMPAAEKVLDETSKLADLYNKIDDKTGGWLGHLTAVAGVSSSILSTYKAIAALRGLLGGAAVAEGAGAVAGAAGATGTAAVGGGLLSTIAAIVAVALPIVIGAVASYELFKHKDATESEGKSLLEGLPSFVGNKTFDSGDISKWASGIKDKISLGMTDFVAGFEGHAKNGYGVYQDGGGKDTAGIGHLVKPGENLSGLDKQGAMALLGKDLATATAAVKSMVHVALTGNQTKALTDFVFNLGAGKLENSTLLKELNAGHYAAAADQFKYWDKVMQNGHLVANEGLAKRRATEAETFRTPDRPNVTVTQKTDIHIEAGPTAGGTADAMARANNRTNGDLVRNLSGATS